MNDQICESCGESNFVMTRPTPEESFMRDFGNVLVGAFPDEEARNVWKWGLRNRIQSIMDVSRSEGRAEGAIEALKDNQQQIAALVEMIRDLQRKLERECKINGRRKSLKNKVRMGEIGRPYACFECDGFPGKIFTTPQAAHIANVSYGTIASAARRGRPTGPKGLLFKRIPDELLPPRIKTEGLSFTMEAMQLQKILEERLPK